VAGKRLNIVVGEDVYVELVRRYGVRGLSKGVDQLLRAALFADNVVNVKTDNVQSVKAPNVENAKTDNVVNVETDNVESVKAFSVVNAKAASAQPPAERAPPAAPPSKKSSSPVDQRSISPESQRSSSPVDQKAVGPAVERRELKVEAPPPRIELPGKPEPPPKVEEKPVEAAREGVAPGEGARGPTPKQLALIESLLKQLGDDWSSVREVLLLDKGIEAPEDYRLLHGEALDKVIKTLKEWAKHPTARELRDARLKAQRLFEQGIDVGLPESTRDVLRYHLVKLELAEAGALKPRK